MAIILHVDLDAFFASCEKARNPELEDRPVVVCVYSGRGKDSGAVSAADYRARSHGIHAGMPISRARQQAGEVEEDVAFLAADKEHYVTVSERVMSIIDDIADETEAASVDEAYADLSSLAGYAEAEERARELQARVREQEGITASVGIAPNKLVAKMASDRDKPAGLTIVEPGEVEAFLAPLAAEELYGVGPKTAEELRSLGVETVEDLRDVERRRLVEAFGEKKGMSLYRKARGKGETELDEEDAKQLSRLTTLEENTRDLDEIEPVLEELAADVVERLERRGWRYSCATAIVVTTDLDTRTRSTSFKSSYGSAQKLYETALDLTEEFLAEHPDVVVRRAGVRASGFEKGGQKRLGDF